MAIVENSPLHELRSMREQMDRLLDLACSRDRGEEPWVGVWQPYVDIVECDAAVVIMAELPGVDQEDMEVKIEDTTLTIRGERKQCQDAGTGIYHHVERHYGSFQRSFSLPCSIDPEKASAACDKGVLTITLPKKDGAAPRPSTVRIK